MRNYYLRWTVLVSAISLALLGCGVQTVQTTAETTPSPTTGSIDPSFDPASFSDPIFSVIQVSDGRYVTAGRYVDPLANRETDYVARLNPDGSLDPSFTPPLLNDTAHVVREIAGGKLLVGGAFSSAGGDTRFGRLVQLNSDGTLDTSFTPPPLNETVYDIEVTANGYVVGGSFTQPSGRSYLLKVTTTGALDSDFVNPELNGLVRTVAKSPAGTILVGGDFTAVGGSPEHTRLIRLDSSGALDESFRVPYFNRVIRTAVAVDGDSKYLVGGGFTGTGSAGTDYLVRLDQAGGIDESFTPPKLDDWVFSAVQVKHGKYLVGGNFSAKDNVPAHLVLLRNDGTADVDYVPPTLSDWVADVIQDANGKYLIVGAFRHAGSAAGPNYIARLNEANPIETLYKMAGDGPWAESGSNWLAQSFTTGTTGGVLSSISVTIRNASISGGSSATGNLTLELYDNSQGVPGRVLATLGSSHIGLWQNDTLTFNPSTALAAGKTYFVVFKGERDTISWKYDSGVISTDVRPAPSFSSLTTSNSGASWSAAPPSTGFIMTAELT